MRYHGYAASIEYAVFNARSGSQPGQFNGADCWDQAGKDWPNTGGLVMARYRVTFVVEFDDDNDIGTGGTLRACKLAIDAIRLRVIGAIRGARHTEPFRTNVVRGETSYRQEAVWQAADTEITFSGSVERAVTSWERI